MKRIISTTPTPENIAAVLELLAATPGRLEDFERRLIFKENKRPRPEEWSPVEVLAHLINVEARTAEAIMAALLCDEPLLIDIHPQRQWGRLLQLERIPYVDLLAYFRLRRQILLGVLESLASQQWNRSVRETGKKRHESVYWLVRAMALHEHEHVQAIDDRFKESGPDAS